MNDCFTCRRPNVPKTSWDFGSLMLLLGEGRECFLCAECRVWAVGRMKELEPFHKTDEKETDRRGTFIPKAVPSPKSFYEREVGEEG